MIVCSAEYCLIYESWRCTCAISSSLFDFLDLSAYERSSKRGINSWVNEVEFWVLVRSGDFDCVI